MPKKIDITGQKYGRLTVIEAVTNNQYKNKNTRYKCRCDCGKVVIVRSDWLKEGRVKSCGCYGKEISKKLGKKEMAFIKENNLQGFVDGTQLCLIAKTSLCKNNTSGVTGVYWEKSTNKWNARIEFQKRKINLGYFSSFEDAVNARKEAEEKYFKPMLEKHNWPIKEKAPCT